MQVLFATNNSHKLREMRGIFSGHHVMAPADFGLNADVEESGDTFFENALLKARAIAQMVDRLENASHLVVIADDSGLCVDALQGGPGIYSARYGSKPDGSLLESTERNALLLAKLAATRDRSAHFTCCMVALLGGDRMIAAQEQWSGEIAHQPSEAAGGFGYDPIFYLPALDCTAADLTEEEKNRLSHRGRAASVVAAALDAAASLP